MSFQLVTDYPWWYIIFCIALGALYAWVLYRKNEFSDDETRGFWPWVMTSLRFLSVAVLAFLLLSPLVKFLSREVEKPVIVIAVDNSESVTAGKDSGFYRTGLARELDEFRRKMSDKYEVRSYVFGNEIREDGAIDFSDKQTNIASLFDEISRQYSNQNLGALILATDGIYNQGNNPLYETRNLKVPVFTLALGDTTLKKDVLVKNVRYNRISYLGNLFPLVIEVDAFKSKGANTVLTVSREGKVVFEKNIPIDADRFSTSVPVSLKADEKGVVQYSVSLSSVKDEVSLVNNRFDLFVEVLDARQKILLVGNSPHPDLGALRQAIESNDNYQVVTGFVGSVDPGSLSGYDLVVLHQVPGAGSNAAGLINKIRESSIPVLMVMGSQTSVPQLNQLGWGLNIGGNRGNTNEVLPVMNKDFLLFTISPETVEKISAFPPLKAPFGNYANPLFNVLAVQQVGLIKTQIPLIAFGQDGNRKTGWLCGEGFWRWRLADYESNLNHTATNELVSKMVQYLAVKDDKRRFRVNIIKKNFNENERVFFDGELYNESYELINTPDVEMKISDREGKVFNYVFSKTSNAYSLDAGVFPEGKYSYTAKVTLGGKTETVSGVFSVTPIQAEFMETVANHNLLYNLALNNNGEMIYPDQIGELADRIKQREDIRPVSYTESKLKDLVNMKWVFFVILVLVSAEWFLRKRQGGY